LTLPVETLKSVPRGKAVWNANGGFVSVLLTHLLIIYILPAIRSLERRARYLFYCMFFFVRSTISRQPAGRFTPKFSHGRTLAPDESSPLLGVSGPRRTEKGGHEIFVTMGVNGEFLHFGGL